MNIINNSIRKTAALFVLAFLALSPVFAQDKEQEQAALAKNIQAQQYVFQARTALPMSGRLVNLTSLYDLRVSGDTLVAFLPYFGRAFTAPVNPSEGGIRFTSTDFEYKTRKSKKGWEVEITPKDVSDVRQMLLRISENGYATLQVTSNRRQPISFNGFVEGIEGQKRTSAPTAGM